MQAMFIPVNKDLDSSKKDFNARGGASLGTKVGSQQLLTGCHCCCPSLWNNSSSAKG